MTSTQHVAYVDPDTLRPRIGLYNPDDTIQPLSFPSGTPIDSLYQVIEVGPRLIYPYGDPLPFGSVKLLPPISGRDILAVGKNYMEHAKEFNSSGFDSSDKVDRPSHPVIFTKRATSIIAHGEEIYPHLEFSKTVDYEGEIGVIIGRSGFRIPESEAMHYVWGYTIINDLTARERQRDHKQFYIGKSPDTFCPMGPFAVQKENLPKTLRLQTHVNGELRQDATSDDLIFSIPTLIKTISEGTTIRPGDVIATGTPAGVGIGKIPPVYLKPGDEIAVSITGLGTLRNKVASDDAPNPTVIRIAVETPFENTNWNKSIGAQATLTQINCRGIYYKKLGQGDKHIVFVHGLGATSDYWTPLISALSLADTHTLHLFDLEGFGQSPSHPLIPLTIGGFALDNLGIFEHAGISSKNPAILIAHSMGCLAAMRFVVDRPNLVTKLILSGPPRTPTPEDVRSVISDQAKIARIKGMGPIADAVSTTDVSAYSQENNPLSVAAVRLSLLGQDPDSYAKGCWAIAKETGEFRVEDVQVVTLIITGEEDRVSTPDLCEEYKSRITGSKLSVLKNVGHWHVFENVDAIAKAIAEFLR